MNELGSIGWGANKASRPRRRRCRHGAGKGKSSF